MWVFGVFKRVWRNTQTVHVFWQQRKRTDPLDRPPPQKGAPNALTLCHPPGTMRFSFQSAVNTSLETIPAKAPNPHVILFRSCVSEWIQMAIDKYRDFAIYSVKNTVADEFCNFVSYL